MDDGIRRINCVFTSTAQTGKREAPFGGSTAAFGRSGAVPRPAQARVHRFSPPGAGRTGLFALLIACVAAFSLFFALELTRSDIGAEAFAALRASAGTADNAGAGNDGGTEQSRDDRPGRLHLVELPGMLTVFAPSDSPILPLPFERFELGDDLTVGIYAPAGTEVFSVLSGTVRSVTDSGVTVACDGGIEVTYLGLSDIRVERGQPVLQRTVLGVTAGETLRLRVTRDGRPIDPAQFLGVGARLS